MKRHLFCYGTLQIPYIIRAVIGRVPESIAAKLNQFACYAVMGECYPAVRPEKEAVTHGILYFNLTPVELKKLDYFEGSEYRRQYHCVVTDMGNNIAAHVYVWELNRANRLSRRHWQLERFLNPARYGSFAAKRLYCPKQVVGF